MTQTIEIPSPKANFGDLVQVENYRRRPPIVELGNITGLSYSNPFGTFSWSYDVKLKRTGKNEKSIFIHVGDDGIKASRREN